MSHEVEAPTVFGLMAEFETPDGLVAATEKARLEGYRKMDAYSPIPIEELNEALGLNRTRLPKLVFLGGLLGGLGGYSLEYWTQVIAYPINIGGRPYHSWPHFIPVTFETTVLGAALTAFIGMWALNKLRVRHDHAQQAAAALSPGVQRAGVRARVDRSLLPVHRGVGSAIRPRRHATISPGSASSRSV